MIVNIENLFKIFHNHKNIENYVNTTIELKIFQLNNKLDNPNLNPVEIELIKEELDRLDIEFIKMISSRYNETFSEQP